MSIATIEEDMEAWEDANPRPQGLGPSDYGRCRAFLGYRERGTEPDPGYAPDNRAAFVGSLIHDGAMARRQAIDPDGLYEYAVAIPGLDRKGTVDRFKDGVVDDLKTKGLYAYDKVAERGEAYSNDRGQGFIYAFAMEGEGHEVTAVQITYLNRSNGHELAFSYPYDRNEAAVALTWLLTVQDAIDNDYELPRDGRGPGLDWLCDHCPFLATCWDLANVPEGRTAQSALVVTDAQVADAARDFLEAKDAESKAKKDKEAARAALVGLGGIQLDLDGKRREVRWAKTARWDVADTDAAKELLEAEGLPVPMKEATRSGALSIPVVG